MILGGSGLIFAADNVGNVLGVVLWRGWRRLRGPTWDDYKDKDNG